MKYRLWDIDINRLFGTFDNEDEALALAGTLISSYGDAYAADLALGCERSDGSFTSPLTGHELIARVQQVAQGRQLPSPRAGHSTATRGGATNDLASAAAVRDFPSEAHRNAPEPQSNDNKRKTARRKAG
jgi:hypothetical protein